MPSVTLVTCTELPAGDEDADLLQAALARHGVTSRWVAWDDPDTDWTAEPAVLRSPWDYTARIAQFLAWADAVPRLANDAATVRWNTDKVYLRDVGAVLPTVPTTFAAPGEAVTLPDAAEFVVKPSVGAGSRGAGRFTADRAAAALEHAAFLQDGGRTVLVQPYLDAVDSAGETALLYYAGEYSHAIRKGPMLPAGTTHSLRARELFVEEKIVPREPSSAEHAIGDAAVALLAERFGVPLYARVDLLPGPDGPVVVELELTEPSLFLAHDPRAADRFGAAVAAWAAR